MYFFQYLVQSQSMSVLRWFYAAVMADSVACVRLLLDLGTINLSCQNSDSLETVSISCQNSDSYSAVQKAALHNRSVERMLMWSGATVYTLNVSTCNLTPVFLASQFGKLQSLKLLLRSLKISGTVFLCTHTDTLAILSKLPLLPAKFQ